MNWRNRGSITLAGALLLASGPASVARGQAAPGTSRASVLEWNGRAAQLIVGPGGAAKAPPLGLVDLAIVHTAIYDAVNAVEGFPFRSYGVVADVPGPASGDAAVAAAGRATLLALYPTRGGDIEAWYQASLAAIPDGEEKANGIAVGEQIAAGILALRANDGRNAGTTITEPPAAPGVWVRTPPALRRRRSLGPVHHALEPGEPVAAPARAAAAPRLPAVPDRLRGGAGLRRRRRRPRQRGAEGRRALLGRPADAPVEPRLARDRPRAGAVGHGRRALVRDVVDGQRGRADRLLGRQIRVPLLAAGHRDPRRRRRPAPHRRPDVELARHHAQPSRVPGRATAA